MGWESVLGNSAGQMNGDGSRKLLLHSTEGSTIEGAVGAYRKNNSWPTLTVDCKRRRVVRHLTDVIAARSLRNRAGGVETNRDGSVLIQIELVGFAGDPGSIGSAEDLRWFGAEVVGTLCHRNAIPISSGVAWLPYPQSYGDSPVRMSPAAWDAYSGILGHQHAPENDHGDPGAIDIATILSAARGDDDMEPADIAKGVELAVKAGGVARDDLKTLVQGSLLDGLRLPNVDHPDRGQLREPLKALLAEVLDEREAAAPSAPPAG